MDINERTTHCAIITEEGRVYSEEGIRLVRRELGEMYGVDTGDLVIVQGQVYNEPAQFKKFLEDHPDTYIVVSASDSMDYIAPEELPKLIGSLDTAEQLGHSVWRCLRILTGREPYSFG